MSEAPNPPTLPILLTYVSLGSLISFCFGREPSDPIPENILKEISAVLLIVCSFLISYSIWDVMAVGIAKHETKYSQRSIKEMCSNNPPIPEKVYLSIRVQTNQLEQMPLFIFGSLSCAIFVNGNVTALMSMMWVILRRLYASTYRNAIGVKNGMDIGLSKFTIPAYFLVNSMLAATAVHAIRCLLSSEV